MHVDRISMEMPDLCLKRSHVEMANLGHHCLPKYLFAGIKNKKG